MDATQMICDSILESDEEEENANARAEPLATLRVLKNKHIPETVLPLYLGENVLGRDPTACTLPLRAQSVSKQHTAVSITTFHASSGRAAASIEALVWDMGSMNGTRKGRLKLTPHVRYALSEGDTLLVADIPCQYTSCGVSGGPGNTDSVVAGESQGTGGDDEEVHANGNAEAPAARALLGERGETTMETPATTKALSFEKTPTQPECSLVPESDFDSDGEQATRGRWRKTLGIEDESPITPLLSSKHRLVGCVGAQEAEQDVDTWQQQLKNQKGAPVISTDSEEGELGKRGYCASGKPVNGVSPGAEEESDRPGRMLSTEPIPVLNMDSGSDVEGEEESSVSARDPVTPSRTPPLPANAPTSQLGQFHMDSDTDAEDEDDGTPAPKAGGANATEPPGDLLVAQQTDNDTDVDGSDDDDKLDGVVTKETHASAQSENMPGSSAPFTQPADFNLESDTDVEEEEEEEEDDSMTKHSSAKIESRQVEVASAALPNFDLDSDTDDEVLPAGASEASAHTTPADAAAQLEILSDSDTDVEDDSPPIPPFVAVATNAGLMSSTPSRGPISLSAALGPDSDADTDVDEASPVGVDPANFRMDSDTDVEDEDEEEEAGAEGTVGGQESGSSGEKDFGSLQGHRASLQQWSTPAQGPRTPAPRFMVSSSCSDSQGEDDFVVAETQSFIVDNRDQQQASPSGSYTLDAAQPFIPQGTSTHEEDEGGANGGDSSFQLGLSDSVQLQHPQAQALATEATQAFVLSDRDVNLEATQVYPTGSSLELQATQVYPTGSSLELQATQVYPTGSSLALQATQVYPTTPSVDGSALEMVSEQDATQSYVGSAGYSRPAAGSRLNRQGDFALEETQAYIPESHIDEEEEDEAEEATAETQPMCKLLGEYNAVETQPLPLDKGERERHDGGEQVDGEGTPSVEAGTTRSLSVAETQPMAMSEVEESNDDEDSIVAPRKRTALQMKVRTKRTRPPAENKYDHGAKESQKVQPALAQLPPQRLKP
ncbi:hypothetical protein CRUP_004705 [Coryphaenoides rupestris]|nr:hypothetical protein CRUP_004705 [Coryphaenoides rupestris]